MLGRLAGQQAELGFGNRSRRTSIPTHFRDATPFRQGGSVMDRWLLWKAIALVGIAGSSFVGQSAWGETTLEDNKSGKVSVRQGDTSVEWPPGEAGKNPGSSITLKDNETGMVWVKEGDTGVLLPRGQPGDQEQGDRLPAGAIGAMGAMIAMLLTLAATAAARKKRTQTEQKRETGAERP